MAKSRSGQRRRAGASAGASQAKTRPASPSAPAKDPGAVTSALTAQLEAGTAVAVAATVPRRPPSRTAARPQREGLLAGLSERLGIPELSLVLGAADWLLMLLLWATHEVSGAFAVFLGAVLMAAIAVGTSIAAIARQASLLETLRAGVLLILVGAVPIVFDPHAGNVFNLPRYTIVVIGALVLAGLAVVTAAHERRLPSLRFGLQWPIAAVAVWSVVSTLASKDVNVSLLGNNGSYDGLYAELAFATVAVAAAGLAVGHVGRVLRALAFAAGGVVVLYGLIQLHDVQFGGHLWDFIRWQESSFTDQIFSTFGNPNHLAGYLAIVLPTIVLLGFRSRRRSWRAASALLGLAVVVEILRSAARGSWVAVLASAVVVLLVLAPELRRHPVLSLGGLGGLLAVVAVGMAAYGARFLHQPISSLFQSGGTSSVNQRLEIWRAAAHIAVQHPLTGVGPDMFALVYPQYQSAAWVTGFGPNFVVDGAHDIFMNTLADQGFVGLLLFLVLLAYLAVRTLGAWRRLRRDERRATDGESARAAQDRRLLLAAISAGITAYVVQAVFNVQQIGLSFSFWLLVGLLAAVTSAAGVPNSLRFGRLIAAAQPADPGRDGDPADEAVVPKAAGRSRRSPRPSRQDTWVTALTAVAATAIVVVVSLGADGPWRASHDFWAANVDIQRATATSGTRTAAGGQLAAQFSTDFTKNISQAMALNPWEPQYPVLEAQALVNGSSHAAGAQSARDLTAARTLFARAVADEPLIGQYVENEAIVDVDLARTASSTRSSYLADAVTAARNAVRDNPRNPAYRQLLTTVEADIRTGATNS